jgi:hypothetical protein
MKTASENLLGIVRGKFILILENDADLSIDLEHIGLFLKENKLDYKALNDLPNLNFEAIAEAIKASQVIIFQSTWTAAIVSKLNEFFSGLKDPKHIIEVYTDRPHWFYKPDTTHEVYIMRTNSYLFDPMFEDNPLPYWELHKLHPSIPIWKFKNKFDK